MESSHIQTKALTYANIAAFLLHPPSTLACGVGFRCAMEVPKPKILPSKEACLMVCGEK